MPPIVLNVRLLKGYITMYMYIASSPELNLEKGSFKKWRLAFNVDDLLNLGSILYGGVDGLGLDVE